MKQLLKEFKEICLRSDIGTAKKLMKKRIFDYLDLEEHYNVVFNQFTLDYRIIKNDGYIGTDAMNKLEEQGFMVWI